MGYVKTLKLRLVRCWFNTAYQLFFRLIPKNPRRISFITMRNTKLADNLAAVYAQFDKAQTQHDYDLKTLCFRYDHSLLGKFGLLFASLKATYLLSTSRVTIIDDYLMVLSAINKHSDNKVIQLWHAIGTLKKFGLSLKKNQATNQILKPHINYDLVFINAKQDEFAYLSAFDVTDSQIVACGMPMMDELTATNIQPPVPNTLLYSPTYRTGGADRTLAYVSQFIDSTKELEEDWTIYISLHPYLQLPEDWKLPANVRIFQDPALVKEVMKTVSLFVTDYSSLSLHFSYYERPLLLFVPDMDEYLQQTGFYVDYLQYLAAPHFLSSQAVMNFINTQLYEFDLDYVKQLKARNFPHEDGKNAQRVYQYIYKKFLTED